MTDDQEERLDQADSIIVDTLARDARTSNVELAAIAGIAPSTSFARVRALESRGVLRGYHASINQAALGRGIQALIGVTLRPGSREASITAFADDVRQISQVVQIFFVGGADDYLVHVAVANSSELRKIVVERISAQRSVASTRTSIIFAYQRNAVVPPFE